MDAPENCRLVDVGDVEGLANALKSIIRSGQLRESKGKKSREIISRWSFAEAEAGPREG